MSSKYKDIYDYILQQEASFSNDYIDIGGWTWQFKQHIKTSFFYKHGRLLNGNNDDTPVKNITLPLLNAQYRLEDIDVKNITLYVDDPDDYHLSFLIKKYHDDVFVVENDLDTFLDDVNVSKIDYGIGISKKTESIKPEVVDLTSIAFCDQTNFLKGPVGLRYYYEPDELKEMEKAGWGSEKNGATIMIDELITLSEAKKIADKQSGIPNKTTGNNIEIYEIHGVLPNNFLEETDKDEYVRQFHIVAFYQIEKGDKVGVTLFKKEEKKNPFKVILRDKIPNRAAGFGGAEELFEPQVWTNYDVIRIKNMLDAASVVLLKGIGSDFKKRYPNGVKDLDNLSIIEMNQGEDLGQIDTTPRSMALFERSIINWENHSQKTASVTEPLLGEPSPSGTPFRSQERQVIEGKGLHDYRRGQFAKFVESVYTDWIIPEICDKIANGARFLSELSVDEMNFVMDAVVTKEANRVVIEKVLGGEMVLAEDVEIYKQRVREDFVKSGNKKFIEILKGEFKKKPVKVKVVVAGKQKNLELMTDKLVNIFRQIIANPVGFQQTIQMPGMAEVFNSILETSGLSPQIFSGISKPIPSPIQPQMMPQLLETNQ